MRIQSGLIIAWVASWLGVAGTGQASSPETELTVLWKSPAPVGDRRPAMAVAFSPDGEHLAAAVGQEFAVWRAEDGSQRRIIREPDTPLAASVAFSPDGEILATGRSKPRDGMGRLWRVHDGGLLKEYKAARLEVTTVAFGRSGLLASTGYGNGIRIWSQGDPSTPRTIGGDVQVRFALSFSPDGREIAAPTVRPHAVHIWDIQDGRSRLQLEGHTDFVNDVAYSSDGRLLASCSSDGTLQIHRTSDGERLRTVGGRSRPGDHSKAIRCVAFSPDGRRLYSGGVVGAKGVVRIRDVEGEFLRTHEVETGPGVEDLAVSPNGQFIAYARSDGIVVVARIGRSGAPERR